MRPVASNLLSTSTEHGHYHSDPYHSYSKSVETGVVGCLLAADAPLTYAGVKTCLLQSGFSGTSEALDKHGIRNDPFEPETSFELKSRTVKGMPKNSRQVTEGYWIGSQPSVEQLKILQSNNIRLVVTASRMGTSDLARIHREIESLGMKHLNIPFGGRFPQPEKFIHTVREYLPHEIYIHCEHGGDRSGALLAFLLVTEQGWSIPNALFAVVYPEPADIKGLHLILKKHGFDIDRDDYTDITGIYSAENNGGFGGLKVRSHNYRKLVNTLIDAIIKSQSSKG